MEIGSPRTSLAKMRSCWRRAGPPNTTGVAAPSPGTPRVLRRPRSLPGSRKEPPLELLRRGGPTTTLISDVWPPTEEQKSVVLAPVCGASSHGPRTPGHLAFQLALEPARVFFFSHLQHRGWYTGSAQSTPYPMHGITFYFPHVLLTPLVCFPLHRHQI